MLDPVVYANYIFKDVNGAWLFGPYTDLKLDNEGNAITSNLPTSGGPFQIWNVNLETGEGKLLIDLATDSAKWLSAQFPENTTIRLDRIGVYGDINGDATIMSVVSSGADVYYWNIEDGEWDGLLLEHHHRRSEQHLRQLLPQRRPGGCPPLPGRPDHL